MPILQLVRVTRVAALPGMLSKPSALGLNTDPRRSAVVQSRFGLLVFAELNIEKTMGLRRTMGTHQLTEQRGVSPMPSPIIESVITRMWDQSLAIELESF